MSRITPIQVTCALFIDKNRLTFGRPGTNSAGQSSIGVVVIVLLCINHTITIVIDQFSNKALILILKLCNCL